MQLDVNKSSSFFARLNAVSEKIKNAEKKVTDFISNHLDEIIYLSITEVAERSNTSESTVVRFCKRLGYKGFQDLKINLAKEIINPEKQIHEAIEQNDDVATIKKKIFQGNIQALYDTMEICQNEELARAIDAMSKARLIEIYGNGGSGTVALDAQHKFLKIGLKSFVYTDTHLQFMSASVLTEQDVVIGISHTGSNKNILHAMKLAKKQGATLICITNFSKTPITQISDIKLYTASQETMFRTDAISSRIGQLTILDTLFAGIANKKYAESYSNIQRTRDATTSQRY